MCFCFIQQSSGIAFMNTRCHADAENEYENQSPMNARGTIVTEYKTMVTTISQNGNYFRYKVSLGWNNMPSTRSYDIIGIGFDDPVYIYSPVYFAYAYCFSDGSCTSSADYYHRTKTSTGGSVVYKLPTSNIIGLEAVLYYDVAKNTSNTITRLDMYGDYAHATRSVTSSQYTDYLITHNGIELGSGIARYDEIGVAQSTWGGSW